MVSVSTPLLLFQESLNGLQDKLFLEVTVFLIYAEMFS